MYKHQALTQYINQHPEATGKVVDYNPTTDKLYTFNFTITNTELSPGVIADTNKFSDWITAKLSAGGYKYGVGGYMEHRTLYARSALFDTEEEPRRLHLGVDIWAPAGTPVYAPFDGMIHSFQDNDHFGDYGPTIILKHNLEGLTLYSLYGHLSRASLNGLYEGKSIIKNQQLGIFGNQTENGQWPPHLHFQLMFDLGGHRGDYPGVGKYSEMEKLKLNIPDPDIVLKFTN